MDRTGMVGVAKLSLIAAAIVALLLLVAASPLGRADYVQINGTGINVSLFQPASNGSFLNNNVLNFTFQPRPLNNTVVLGNCTVATNLTGSWAYNNSNATGAAGIKTGPLVNTTENTLIAGIVVGTIPEGAYSWNVYCFDNKDSSANGGQAGFNFTLGGAQDTNFTVHVDTIAPVINQTQPSNGGLISNPNSTVFSVWMNDSNPNAGQNVSLFYKRTAAASYQHAFLSCFDNATKTVPGVTGGAGGSFCNTSIDLATNASLGATETLQFFFNTTDLANNSGSNGTQASPLTATVDQLAPTVTINTPASLANISAGYNGGMPLSVLNITVTDTNRNTSRMYATLFNSSGNYTINQSTRIGDIAPNPATNWSLLAQTGSTDYFTTSLNSTNFTDGGYTLYFNATDSANNSRIATVDINIDNTAPGSFQYGAGTSAATANLSQTFFLVNVTFAENRSDTCFFEYTNTTAMNRSVVARTQANKTSCNFNLTSAPDGHYSYRAYVNDTAGNIGLSAARNITLDTTAPTSAFNVSTNLTKVFPGGPLRANFSFTDATSGVGGQNCGITLMNGTAALSNVSILADRNITMANVSNIMDGTGWCNLSVLLPTNLTAGNNYTVSVTTNDAAGNNANNATMWVTVDNSAPFIAVNAPASGARNLTGAADLINITVDDANLNASAVYAIISNTTHNFTLNGTTVAEVINGPVGNWTALAQGACAANGSTCFFHTALLTNNYNSSHNASSYTIYLYAADTANNSAQTGFNVDIDNNATQDFQFFVNRNTTFTGNTSNLSQTYLFLNSTFRENNTASCTLELTNATAANYTMTIADSNNSMCSKNITLPDNYYRYRIYVTDAAGNVNASERFNVTIDTTAPVLTIPTPANGSFFTNASSGATTFNITISEANLNTSNVTVAYRKQSVGNYQRKPLTCTGGPTTYTCNTSADVSTLGSGDTLEYFFNATDTTMNNTGVNGTPAAPLTSIVDEGGPFVTLPVYSNATYRRNTQTLTLNISAIDNGVGVAGPCKVTVANSSGAINQTIAFSSGWCNGTVDMANIRDGNRSLTVYVNDTLGNFGNATAGYGVNDSYFVYADSLAPNSTELNFTTPGTYPVQANTSSGKFNVSLFLNDSAMSGTLNGTGFGLSGVCLASIGGTANQTVAVGLANQAGLAWCNGTGLSLTGVANGNQTVTIYYNDSAGNVAANATTFVWVDSSAPNITLVNASTLNATVHNRSGVLNLSALIDDSDGVGVAGPCVFNVPGAANYTTGIAQAGVNNGWCNTSNMTLASATEGNQTITVWANDTLNNTRSNQTFRIWIDPAAPNITSVNLTNGTNISSAVGLNLAILANDSTGAGVSTCMVYATGQGSNTTFAPSSIGLGGAFWCNGTLSLTSATAGQNFLTFYANDTANNTNNLSNTYAIVVDDTAPVVRLRDVNNISGGYTNGSAVQVGNNFTLNVSVLDPGAGLTGSCTVYVNTTFATNLSITDISNGLGWCNGSVQVPTNLSAQNHTINVSVRDSAGNWGSNASYAVSVTADSTSPTVVLYNATHISGAYTNATLAKPGTTQIRLNASVNDGSGSGLTNGGACYIFIGGTRVTESVTLSAVSSSFGWCNGTVTVPAALSSANQTINVTYPDVANNNGSNTTHVVDVDGTVPSVNITFPGNLSNISGSSYLINATINDVHEASMVVILKIGNGTGNFSTGAAAGQTLLTRFGTTAFFNVSFNTSAFSDGNYTVFVVANDSINNINTTQINVSIDNTAPSITVASPPSGANLTGAADLVNVTVSDAHLNYSRVYATIGNSTANYTLNITDAVRAGDLSPWSLLLLSSYNAANTFALFDAMNSNNFQSGSYTIYFNATDSANNTAIASQSITIDNTIPNITAWGYSFVNRTLRLIFNQSVNTSTIGLGNFTLRDSENSANRMALNDSATNVTAITPSVVDLNASSAVHELLRKYDLQIESGYTATQGTMAITNDAYRDWVGNTPAAVNITYSNYTRWGVDLPLTVGWNTVSGLSQQVVTNLSWLGTNFSVENVLGSIRGNYNAVYYFNTSSGGGGSNNWTSYVPGRAANDLVNVRGVDEPYYINGIAGDRIQILPNSLLNNLA